jgi:hypothetical protein
MALSVARRIFTTGTAGACDQPTRNRGALIMKSNFKDGRFDCFNIRILNAWND